MVLVGKPGGKRLRESSRCRSENNIKMDLTEGLYWIDLAQDRDRWQALVNTVTNFQVL
jgi:hypothetical protein